MNARHAWLLAAMVAALWPVWRWYALRMADGSDEPWGLLALVAAIGGAAPVLRRAAVAAPAATAGVLLAYAAGFHWLPPLARALLAMTALATLLGRAPGTAGLHGLLLLSLPLLATMQFYLGYPMRVFAAETSRLSLALCGYEVSREGTVLTWAGDALLVDAPCSGVQMLWAGLFLACLLATHFRLDAARTVAVAGGATAIIVLANAARASALFFKEARIVALPEWTHAGAGLLAFAGAAAAILALVRSLTPSVVARPALRDSATPNAWLFAAAALAAAVPLLPLEKSTVREVAHGVEWPAHFDGMPLREVPASERERKFAADFPGRIARFTDGRREFIVRSISAPTRKLHPSADCFRALGHRIDPAPMLLDAQGRRWARFTAVKDGCRLDVRERIVDAAGREWTDVSAWFWSALASRNSGPWLATTIVADARDATD